MSGMSFPRRVRATDRLRFPVRPRPVTREMEDAYNGPAGNGAPVVNETTPDSRCPDRIRCKVGDRLSYTELIEVAASAAHEGCRHAMKGARQ